MFCSRLLAVWYTKTELPNAAARVEELHPLRSLVTSVLGHFGLFLKVRSDQGPNCPNHFGTRDRSVHHLLVQNLQVTTDDKPTGNTLSSYTTSY